MIGKVTRGCDTAGLLRYLFGPGRANEHTNPRLIAAWDDVDTLPPPVVEGKVRVRELAALLDQPLAALPRHPRQPVWQCSLRIAPGDAVLTDGQWADIASTVLDRAGFAARGDDAGCRWVAVRHAEDHIHLAVTIARQDGLPARVSHDYARVGAACRDIETHYALTPTPPRDRTAPRRPTRAETEKTRRHHLGATPREQLRRHVRLAALATGDLTGFLTHLEAHGVHVRLRYSTSDPTAVTGYAVATGINRTAGGDLIWYGGSKLAPYLALPRLQAAWTPDPWTEQRSAPTPSGPPHTQRDMKTISTALKSASIAHSQAERGDYTAAAITAATAALRLTTARRNQ